jgi:hypothetical protein
MFDQELLGQRQRDSCQAAMNSPPSSIRASSHVDDNLGKPAICVKCVTGCDTRLILLGKELTD